MTPGARDRPLHRSLPRRPARTSEYRDEPRDATAAIRTFHRSRLENGASRAISILAKGDGPPPVVSIQHWSPHGSPCGHVLIFIEHTRMVARAVAIAIAGNDRGRHDVGGMPFSDGGAIKVWARVDDDGVGLVVFGRVSRNGAHAGPTTTLKGPELVALGEALEALDALAGNGGAT